MVALEHIMVRIPYPRQRAGDGNGDCEIRDNTDDEHCVVVVLVVDEDRRDLEDEPSKPRQRAARVNASQVLKY